jgi:hypothetical protein
MSDISVFLVRRCIGKTRVMQTNVSTANRQNRPMNSVDKSLSLQPMPPEKERPQTMHIILSVFLAYLFIVAPNIPPWGADRAERRRRAAELDARAHWERQHAALLEQRPELRAELARQAAERESATRAAERRRQAIATRAYRTGAGLRRTWTKIMKAAA